jgi:hypothetical protein
VTRQKAKGRRQNGLIGGFSLFPYAVCLDAVRFFLRLINYSSYRGEKRS